MSNRKSRMKYNINPNLFLILPLFIVKTKFSSWHLLSVWYILNWVSVTSPTYNLACTLYQQCVALACRPRSSLNFANSLKCKQAEEGGEGVNFANCWLTGSDIDPGVDCRRRRRHLQEPRRPRGSFSDAASTRIPFDIFCYKK